MNRVYRLRPAAACCIPPVCWMPVLPEIEARNSQETIRRQARKYGNGGAVGVREGVTREYEAAREGRQARCTANPAWEWPALYGGVVLRTRRPARCR